MDHPLTELVDNEYTVSVLINLSKVLDTIYHEILIETK